MTSLCLHFHNGKKLYSRLFSTVIFFICQPIFKTFVALFTTFEMQRIVRLHFAGGVSGQGDMQKGSFQMMV